MRARKAGAPLTHITRCILIMPSLQFSLNGMAAAVVAASGARLPRRLCDNHHKLNFLPHASLSIFIASFARSRHKGVEKYAKPPSKHITSPSVSTTLHGVNKTMRTPRASKGVEADCMRACVGVYQYERARTLRRRSWVDAHEHAHTQA